MHEIGSLEPGKRADIAIFDLDKPYVGVLHRPLSSFICAGKGSDVRAVLVDGQVVYRDGKFARLADVAGRDRRGRTNRPGDRWIRPGLSHRLGTALAHVNCVASDG